METLIATFIDEQKKGNRLTRKQNKLTKKQNRLIKQLLILNTPSGKEYLQNNLLDNTDIKAIFKIADTKYYELKKHLPYYRPLGKDYYFADEVIQNIKKYGVFPEGEITAQNPPNIPKRQ